MIPEVSDVPAAETESTYSRAATYLFMKGERRMSKTVRWERRVTTCFVGGQCHPFVLLE